jgi:hypothetical protein
MSGTIISPWFTVIFNHYFKTGIFPSELKLAKVFPLFKNKKGNKRNNAEHYRPISILQLWQKYRRESCIINYTTILPNTIFCQVKTKHSTVTSLLHATNGFYTTTGVIFIDLKKAFDSVNHEIFIIA